MAGKFVGANRLLVLQWRPTTGDIYETGFLPRYRADVDKLETALWWHRDPRDAGPTAPPAAEQETTTVNRRPEGPHENPSHPGDHAQPAVLVLEDGRDLPRPTPTAPSGRPSARRSSPPA